MKHISTKIMIALFVLVLVAGCATPTPAPTAAPAAPATEAAPPAAAPTAAPAAEAAPAEPAAEPEVVKPENYPTKPVEFIVPAPAGAAIDVPSRALAEVLDLTKPVVIVNKPGASQTLGTTETAGMPADGYALLLGANGNFMIQPSILDLAYKSSDFRHIAMITPNDPIVLIVTPDSPIKTFQDFEAKIKSGEPLKYSAANPGSIGHLGIASLLKKMGSTGTTFVPFTGSAEGITALLGGNVDFYVADNSEATQRVANKQVVPLAVFSDKHSLTLPDVPTLEEVGYPDMSFEGYKWIAVKAGTPDDVVEYLKQQINAAIQTEAYQTFLKNTSGGGFTQMSEEEITALVENNQAVYKEILTDLGMAKEQK